MAHQKQKRPRTYARNRATAISRKGYEKIYETDGTYFLKLVLCILLGTLWLGFGQPLVWGSVPIGGVPLGLFIGLILVNRFEKLQSDRKIWYAILLVAAIVSYFFPAAVML